ncbi:hypothetical protein BS50DRAFT_638354 [Corynespora cassiicola Philippines]|uniref:MARVEL domain-containing protein n=1 Tax=Corynespora cassiicola Philippines TaxID=1448308 RepID=A0A2T2NBB8_CORCC|nr:hypothetical protein BS50DRAFT_638354 [Corynespora cassiicola Philippines]
MGYCTFGIGSSPICKEAMTAIIIHALNFLAGSICTTILGLTLHCLVLKNGSENYLPSNAKATGMGLFMWAGVGGIVDAFLLLALLIISAKKRRAVIKPPGVYSNAILFVSAFIFARATVVLSYAFYEFNNSTDGSSEKITGYVTVESWACGSARDVENIDRWRSLCVETRAARYLLVPNMVLGAALLGMVAAVRLVRREEKS